MISDRHDELSLLFSNMHFICLQFSPVDEGQFLHNSRLWFFLFFLFMMYNFTCCLHRHHSMPHLIELPVNFKANSRVEYKKKSRSWGKSLFRLKRNQSCDDKCVVGLFAFPVGCSLDFSWHKFCSFFRREDSGGKTPDFLSARILFLFFCLWDHLFSSHS